MEPEQKLFLGVIIQLLEDFVKPVPTGSTEEESKVAKLQAIAWFRGNSLDYVEVCDNAGIHPKYLRTKVLSAKPPYKELQELLDEYRFFVR